MNVSPNDELLRSYAERAAGRVGQQAQWNPELGCYTLDAKNWSVLAVKMHHYFFIARDDAATVADFDAYVKACVEWGLENYRGVPRGLQKGVAIYPVLVQTQPSAEVIAYTKQKPNSHWAAFALPTVVSASTGVVEYLEKTPMWGFAMWSGVRRAAQSVLG